MKNNLKVFRLFLILFFGFLVCGCAPAIEKFGDAPSDSSVSANISSILLNPQQYADKEIVIDGMIVNECPSGCWINVRDSSGGMIFVELLGQPFVPIPQRTGKNVRIKGKVYQSSNGAKEVKFMGKGFVIK